MNYPKVNIPAGKQVMWNGFTMCEWDKTIEIISPEGQVLATGYKKYDSTQLQQLRLKNGEWIFNSGRGGDFTIKITSNPGGNPEFLTQTEPITKFGRPYATSFVVCTEDAPNIDKDFNDCTVVLSWTNQQG